MSKYQEMSCLAGNKANFENKDRLNCIDQHLILQD